MTRNSPSAASAQSLRRPRSLRHLLVAIGLAAAVALLPAVALATTLGYQVSGLQVGLTNHGDGTFTSTFAGVAASTPPGEFGLWKAAVVRSAFTDGDAVISGGTFQMKTNTGRIVTGTFTGGTVDGAPPSGCANESFVVTGSLDATSGGEVGGGTFIATLTHFQRFIFGACRTLAASVKGAVAFELGPPPAP